MNISHNEGISIDGIRVLNKALAAIEEMMVKEALQAVSFKIEEPQSKVIQQQCKAVSQSQSATPEIVTDDDYEDEEEAQQLQTQSQNYNHSQNRTSNRRNSNTDFDKGKRLRGFFQSLKIV